MKVTFVVPAIDKRPGHASVGRRQLEPLAVAALTAVTPEAVETELVDDRLQLVDPAAPTDLAALSVTTVTARRAYALADAFRARGVPVVLGGPHVTLLPEEAAEHADALVLGAGESVWAEVLRDSEAGHLRRAYRGGVCTAPPHPDRRLFAGRRYLPFGIVEAGRGCAHDCTFCSLTRSFSGRHHARPIADVASEISHSPRPYHVVVDDNLLYDKERIFALCDLLAPRGRTWAVQAGLDVGGDPELLARLKRAHCELLLIDFGSLDPDGDAPDLRPWNAVAGERAELVRRIHAAGIGIHAAFTFGHDADTPATFDRVLDFAESNRLFGASFSPLLPLPGTPLHDRLAAEGRLRFDRWWLAPGYHYGELPFEPARMPAAQVGKLTARLRADFASPLTFATRAFAALRRNSQDGVEFFVKVNGGFGLPEPGHVPATHLGESAA